MQVVQQQAVNEVLVTEYQVDIVVEGTNIDRIVVAKFCDEEPDTPEEELHGTCATVYVKHNGTISIHMEPGLVEVMRDTLGMRDFCTTEWKDFATVVAIVTAAQQ